MFYHRSGVRCDWFGRGICRQDRCEYYRHDNPGHSEWRLVNIDIEYAILFGVIGLCLYPFVMWGIIKAHELETKEKEKDD